MVPTSWQDEALARDGVSREVPCSALKGETVPDSLPATPKIPRQAGFPQGEHRGSRHRFLCAPSPLLLVTGESIPLRGLERVPGLPGTRQDEAGLTRKFETSHVGGATCRTTPFPWSALEKDPRPGPLFEVNPVGEGTTRRGTATPVHRPQRPAGSTHSSTRGLRHPELLEMQAGSLPQTRRGLTLLSQLCRDPAVGVRNGEEASGSCLPSR